VPEVPWIFPVDVTRTLSVPPVVRVKSALIAPILVLLEVVTEFLRIKKHSVPPVFAIIAVLEVTAVCTWKGAAGAVPIPT
jgi:hypothetical protein